jgi:hypothetical protein
MMGEIYGQMSTDRWYALRSLADLKSVDLANHFHLQDSLKHKALLEFGWPYSFPSLRLNTTPFSTANTSFIKRYDMTTSTTNPCNCSGKF